MSYDVIIIGGGAAGCVLANRLTEDADRSVLLLEAGTDFSDADDCPPAVRDEWSASNEHMWYYKGIRTPTDENPIDVVRGKVMGGSSAVNGMAYQRGTPEDYDSWGSSLWTYESLRPFFEKIERDLESDDDTRGQNGQVPLQRLRRDQWSPTQEAFYRSAVDLGFPEVPDLFSKRPHGGVGPIVRNSYDGTRMSGAYTYLNPIRHRSNLTIQGETTVKRVVTREGRATGVEMVVGGKPSVVDTDQVILCAGAIESPQLLMLSGIGPADVLDKLNIPVIQDLPGVGRNLSDHPLVAPTVSLKTGVERGDPRFIVGLEYTADQSQDQNDMLFLTCSGKFGTSVMASVTDGTETEFSIYVMLQLPESVGEIELTSGDANDLPSIHYHYLQSDNDRMRMRQGVRYAARMLKSPQFEEITAEYKGPTPQQLDSDSELDAWIATSLATTLHGTGTCKMGPRDDASAVVDDHGRVRGIDGLRVADLSIGPKVVRSTTHATALVIGERIAQIVRDESAATAATSRQAATSR